MMTSTTPNSAYFLRLPIVQIKENQNHCYHVLAALMEYNKNIVDTTCFSLGQAYEFLGLKPRTTYVTWQDLNHAYQQMIADGYIRSKPPKDIGLDTLLEAEILPAFYSGGFYMLAMDTYKKMWNLQIPFKEKLFHVYLYMNAFKKYNPSVLRIAKSTGIARNTVYSICEQIEINEL